MSTLRPSRATNFAAAALLALHAGLLAWSTTRHSPSIDEVGHMAAGLSHWTFGRFDLYRVNPPLVRLLATAPVALARPTQGWDAYSILPGARSEFECGRRFIAANGARSFWLFTTARWACIPFSLLGGWICFRWARELYGNPGALVSLTLWCFCPNLLAHAQMITPDAGATALGAAAGYAFWRWLRRPTWERTFVSGVVLGLAELTKMTFLVLYALGPLLWLVWVVSARSAAKRSLRSAAAQPPPPLSRQALQLALAATLSVYVINVGYAFEGSLERLGAFNFVSRAFGGPRDLARPEARRHNRFAESALGAARAPLPANYLLGIDNQKFDFELGYDSYLRGEWKHGGWWYYYLYALGIKVPLGTWALFALALVVGWALPTSNSLGGRDCETREANAPRGDEATGDEAGRWYPAFQPRATWRDELVLLLPAAAILALVSSQTGFNHHLRYVLPIFPLFFVWMGRLGRLWAAPAPDARCLVASALAWSVGSSLWYYPHSLSYFNELVGGPMGGRWHLVDSNLDWGQDVLHLKRWIDEHPEARPLGFAYFGSFDPRVAGIDYSLPPLGPTGKGDAPAAPTADLGPRPGWYAVSAMMLHGYKYQIPDGAGATFYTDRPYFAYFQHFEPVATAGYSIYIYHIQREDANRVRRLLGLPALTEPSAPTAAQSVEDLP